MLTAGLSAGPPAFALAISFLQNSFLLLSATDFTQVTLASNVSVQTFEWNHSNHSLTATTYFERFTSFQTSFDKLAYRHTIKTFIY